MTQEVRQALDDEDFARFHDLQVEYEDGLPPDLRHRITDIRSLPRVYADPNAVFLAFDAATAAGCIAARRLDTSTNVLQRLYVKPAYRGHGLARVLVDAVISLSREQQYVRVVLDTDKDQLQAAYRLYVALGFTECDAYAPVDYASPTYMELRLR